jgi:hypothetical protein
MGFLKSSDILNHYSVFSVTFPEWKRFALQLNYEVLTAESEFKVYISFIHEWYY